MIKLAIEGLGDMYGAAAGLDRENWRVLHKKALGDELPRHWLRAPPGIQVSVSFP